MELVGVAPRGGDLVGVPFRRAPVKGLAGVDDVVEGADGFFDGGVAVRPVGVDEVDVVELQTFEAGVEALDNVFSGEAAIVDGIVAKGTAKVDLGGDDQVVTLPPALLGSDLIFSLVSFLQKSFSHTHPNFFIASPMTFSDSPRA